MPQVKFKKDKPSFHIEKGAILMRALLARGLPVASSCLGKGICSKCRIEIVDGHKNLSKETALEIELRQRNKIPENMRISCQTQVLGDITIDTSYW